MPIIQSLLHHDEDVDDPQLPLLIWWALEKHCDQWDEVENMLSDADLWNTAICSGPTSTAG